MYRCWRRKRSKSLPKFSEESLSPVEREEPPEPQSQQSPPATQIHPSPPRAQIAIPSPKPGHPPRAATSQVDIQTDYSTHILGPGASNETVTDAKELESDDEPGYETIDRHQQVTAVIVSTETLGEPSTSRALPIPESSKEDLYSKPMKKVKEPAIIHHSPSPIVDAEDNDNETMDFSHTDSTLSGSAPLEETQRKSIAALQTLQLLKRARNESIQVLVEKTVPKVLHSEDVPVSASPTLTITPKDPSHLKDECIQLWQKVNTSQTSVDSGFPRQFGVVDDLCHKQHQLISILSREHQKLENNLERAGEEIALLRQTIQEQREKDSDSVKSIVVKSADVETLEDLVRRLTVELNHYQQKFGEINDLDNDQEDTGLLAFWPIETQNLLPLFKAYDNQLQQKNDNIKQFERNFSLAQQELDEVNSEYNKLKQEHSKAEENWKALYQQAELVLEENTKMVQKRSEMHEEHKRQVKKLADRLMTLEKEKNVLEKDVSQLQNSKQLQQQKYVELEAKMKKMLPMEDYLETVKKFDQNTNKLKEKHSKEIAHLEGKLQASRSEQRLLSVEIADLKATKCQQEGRNKALLKMLKEAQNNAVLYERQYVKTVHEMTLAGHYLGSIQNMAGQISAERQTYIKLTQEQYDRAQQLLNELNAGKQRKAQLQEKLNHYKTKMKQKVKTNAQRARKNRRNIISKFQKFQKENRRLRRLLEERKNTIESLLSERRQLEEDIEKVWRYAATENKEMQQIASRYNR